MYVSRFGCCWGISMLNQTQVEEIAQVPGIDVLFIGPWDLGNNIGRPVLGAFHDDLNAAIDRIFKAAVDNGKRVGIYCTGGEPARKYADQGFHMVTKTFCLPYLYSPADTSRSPSLPMLWPSQHSFPTRCKPPKGPSLSLLTASMQIHQYTTQIEIYCWSASSTSVSTSCSENRWNSFFASDSPCWPVVDCTCSTGTSKS